MSGYVLPVHAFWKMGVEKTDAVKQEKQADKAIYKDITKQKEKCCGCHNDKCDKRHSSAPLSKLKQFKICRVF